MCLETFTTRCPRDTASEPRKSFTQSLRMTFELRPHLDFVVHLWSFLQRYFENESYSVLLLISLLLAFSCFGEREESWLKFDVKEFRSPKIVTYHYYSILSRAVYGGSKPLFRLVINHCARGIIVPCKIELKVKSLLETRAVELIKGWQFSFPTVDSK